MAQQAGDGVGADQLLGGGPGGSTLRVEVELPQIFTSLGGRLRRSASTQQRAAQVDQTNVGHLPGEGDVQDGEPGAGVSHHLEQC